MNLYKIFLLKLILFIGQRTFLGRGIIRKKLVRLIEFIIFSNDHQNLNNYKFICKILGVPFYFIFDKILDYKVYFCRSERKEIFFIKKNTTDNTVFFDIGANMGIYTQMVASSFDKIKNSTIIAIEPDPLNCFRIKRNLGLLEKKIPNIFNQVKIEECGVGEINKEMYLTKSYGPANGTVIESYEKNSIKIKVKTLLDIVEVNKISHITNLKIDIEGYEDKALLPFFKNANKELYPKNIVIEYFLNRSILDYLKSIGYKISFMNASNAILQLK